MRNMITHARSLRRLPLFSNALLFTLYFLLIALTLARSLGYGFTGDESGYVALNTEEFAAHLACPYIFTPGLDTGHPMLYAYPVAVLWRLFGQSNAAANIMMWICAALSLVATHRLAQRILAHASVARLPRWAGPAAALALYSTPLFISHAAQYLDPMPYLALLLWMLLAWAGGRRKTLALLGAMLSLIRITGCLSVLGLGMFDLAWSWFALRRRTWRDSLITLAPYLAAAAVFLAYLAIKLIVLKRSLTNFAGHTFGLADWPDIRRNILNVRSGIYGIPPYSFKPLIEFTAVAFIIVLLRRHLRLNLAAPAPENPPSPLQPGALAIYGAALASMLFPTLFAIAYRLDPQPRWFLPYHAFFVIMALHAMSALLGRSAQWALPLLALWCGLQAMRWQNHWVERCGASLPPATRARLLTPPPFTLDILQRKELNHRAAAWVAQHAHAPTLFCAWPTSGIFQDRAAGYAAPYGKAFKANWLLLQPDPLASFNAVIRDGREVYVVEASWDLENEKSLLSELMRPHAFRQVFMERSGSGEWIGIYKAEESSAPFSTAGLHK